MEEKNLATERNHCNYFIMRKKRYCRLDVHKNTKYCAEHLKPVDLPEDPNNADKSLRVVCPLDRKHTCYAHKLKKHLKICNAAIVKIEPYISKGINAGDSTSNETAETKLSDYTEEEIKTVIEKVNKIYDEYIKGKITEKFSSHQIVEEEMKKPEYGEKSKKHLTQASSILGLLSDYELFKPKTCFIEFGAGRGQLSFWISSASEVLESSVLLIERASPKHKRDNKLAKSSDKVQRIRADISDLVLDKVELINQCEFIVGVTKHLCGEATDLALTCLKNISINREKLNGLVMTFCCHHRCKWGSFVGKEFFKKNDLNEKDFAIMTGLASWATCGSGFSRDRLQKEQTKSKEENEEIGRRCKNVINWGRIAFMQNEKFECNLHYYTDRSITLENVCIVARRQR